MSVLLMHGFDHTSTTVDLFSGLLMASSATSASLVVPSVVTQFGGHSLSVQTSDPNGLPSAAYAAAYVATSATIFVGASIALTPTANSGYDIGITNGVVCQMFCRFILDHLYVYRGDPVTGTPVLIGSAITGLASSGWAYVELEATIATSGAILSIYVNGLQVVNLTGLNTSNDGTTTIAGIALGAYDGNGTGFIASFDDVYVADSSGAAPSNTLLGPIRVILRLPSDNNSVAFTPNSANPNWQEINDIPSDQTTSYNYSSTISATDTYISVALPTTTTVVFAVQVIASVRKDDAGSRTMATVLNSVSMQATGNTIALAPSYQYIYDIYPLDPNGNLAWTVTSANVSTFGYTIVN